MPVSRPLLIALAAAVLLAVGMTVMRAMSAGAAADPAAEAPPKPPAAKPSAAKPAQTAPKPAAKRKSGEKARPSKQAEQPRRSRLQSAVARGDVVVVFVGQDSSADDRATRDALRGVDRRGVTVIFEPVERAAAVGRELNQVQITQIPAVVIVDRQRRARVLEGFRDRGSLAQEVADAR